MKINIGNNNKIKQSTIGNNNNKEDEMKLSKVIVEVIIGLIVGLVVEFCIYKFGWNK